MPPAHRHGDPRECGASTVVQNQSTVEVNGRLWAVLGTVNDHGNGALINTTGDTVFVEGKPVIVHGPDNAFPDDRIFPPHSDPKTAGGSGDVFAYG